MFLQIKKLCFRKFFYSIIIILCLFVCKGNLWAYDRFAEPSVQASWSLADTKPEKLPLPKTKMRVNRVESDIKLRLYKNTNEVVNIEMNTLKKLEINTDIIKAKAQVIIKRGKKEVYNESITLQTNGVFTYTGGNKDYKIQDVFVSDTWLKTGYFSSTVSKLSDTYEYCIIDYTYLKIQILYKINKGDLIYQISFSILYI